MEGGFIHYYFCFHKIRNMTHIINYNNPNLVLLNGNTALYFTSREDFETDDTILLQEGRSESRYVVKDIIESPSLKKNTVMLNLTREEA